MRVSCHIFCMHHLKWCMCAVLWLQFAPSFYHHDPSIFNYIRYCLKWMFLLHSTSPTHISLTCSLAHSLRSSHNHAAISLKEREKEIKTQMHRHRNVLLPVSVLPTINAANAYAMISFDTFIGCSCYISLSGCERIRFCSLVRSLYTLSFFLFMIVNFLVLL